MQNVNQQQSHVINSRSYNRRKIQIKFSVYNYKSIQNRIKHINFDCCCIQFIPVSISQTQKL